MRYLFLLLLFSLSLLATESVCLKNSASSFNLVPHSAYVMDSEHQLHKDNILQHQELFAPAEKETYSFGFTRDDVWIRFVIERCEPLDEPWIINIAYSHLDEYTLYLEEEGALKEVMRGGDQIVSVEPMYENRMFWNPVADVERGVYYLHVRTEGSMQIPIRAEKLSYSRENESTAMLYSGIYYGILLLILIYNIVLFAVLKEIHYLNYLLFITAYMLWQLSFDGIGVQRLWPDSTWLANSGMSLFIFMCALTLSRFARMFLHLKMYAPKTERVLRVAEYAIYVCFVLVFVLDFHHSIKIAAVMAASMPLLLIYAGFAVLPVYRPARFYMIGWAFFLVATTVTALDKLGLIDSYEMMWSIQQVGSLLEMLFLSFALADRIYLLKKKHIETLQRLNTTLKEEIEQRVGEIRDKDQLMIHQSRQAAMGEMIENIAHQWRQPLHQLSLVQQNIFIGYTLKNLDDRKMRGYQEQSDRLLTYMTDTIDDFRNFFHPNRVQEPFFICEAISKVTEMASSVLVDENIKLEFICDKRCKTVGFVNEFSQVMMNLINNAKEALLEHKVEDPKIVIRLRTHRDGVTVSVCDNAGGIDDSVIEKVFDPYFTTKFKSQGTGIGLYMSKMIIEKSMQGRLSVANQNGGACFEIILPNRLE